ncbi:hypothetical protein PVL29_023865 [Vitis rotundifolia]|uniref:Cytochrome P450 n=1 Tax=Vitis rotundifolia TaxID=103349 RepID=A0AA38YQ36_VITRO|nr:hypothetical protein PVL29_023865 [Vitis rotundifolia]
MYFLLQYLNFTTVGVFATLLLSYCLLLWRSRAGNSKIAPEATATWPIIDHLHLLGGSDQLPHITLGNMADKYGPVFTIRLGVHRALVVSSWEMAKECLTTNDLAASSRPQLLASKHLGYNYAMFGFSPYGSYWRELLKDVRASEVVTSIKELYKLWTEKKNESGLVSVEMKQWFGDLTLNVILRMVAGKRYFSASDASENKQAQRCRRVFREFSHLSGLFATEKTLKKTAKEMDSIAQEWLEEHRRRKDSGKDNSTQDFMDVMLSVLDGKNLGDYDADTINKATCLALIVGGSDTTVVTLTWELSLLLNNRDTLKKAQEELDHIQVGKKRLVNEQDISKLVYLQAIVKETLRLYLPVTLGGPRQFTEDCTLGGYHVSKGTRLILNLSKIQKDPRIWLGPTEFQPERFLTTHKDLDPRGKYFEFIPFGIGRRACTGIAFALQMLHLTLANFLQAFDFSTPSNALVDMRESLGLTNMKSTPIEVLISPRMSLL